MVLSDIKESSREYNSSDEERVEQTKRSLVRFQSIQVKVKPLKKENGNDFL